jgi:hypothetical protein
MRAHLQAKRRGPTLTHGVENPLDTLGRGRLLQCRNAQTGTAQSLPQRNPAVEPADGERPAAHDVQGCPEGRLPRHGYHAVGVAMAGCNRGRSQHQAPGYRLPRRNHREYPLHLSQTTSLAAIAFQLSPETLCSLQTAAVGLSRGGNIFERIRCHGEGRAVRGCFQLPKWTSCTGGDELWSSRFGDVDDGMEV